MQKVVKAKILALPESKTENLNCLKLITSKTDYAIFCDDVCNSRAINFPRKGIGKYLGEYLI